MKWNNSFALGIEEIDAQHKKIFERLLAIENAVTKRDPWHILRFQLDELAAYMKFHLAVEEAMLEIIRYPARSEHRESHARILEQVAELEQLERRTPTRGHVIDVGGEAELLDGRGAVAAAHDGERLGVGERLGHGAGAGLEARVLEHADIVEHARLRAETARDLQALAVEPVRRGERVGVAAVIEHEPVRDILGEHRVGEGEGAGDVGEQTSSIARCDAQQVDIGRLHVLHVDRAIRNEGCQARGRSPE